MDVEFSHQAGPVGVHRFRTQLQARGDLLSPDSVDQEAEHLVLPRAQCLERIFGIPGIGEEFVNSALNRDYTLVMGTVILYGVLLVMFNLVVDILYGFLDPRIRYG